MRPLDRRELQPRRSLTGRAHLRHVHLRAIVRLMLS